MTEPGPPPVGQSASFAPPSGTEPGKGRRPGWAARRRARRLPPPLPQREGLDAVRWQIPRDAGAGPAARMLLARFPALADPDAAPLADRFAGGEIVDAHGRAWAADDIAGPGDELWFHRELREEAVPTDPLPVLFRDEHLLVIDKPHDVATMPRGAHVLSSALVRLRRETGIADLVPLHRLDRRTAGVLAFGVRPEERSAYQQLFARREVDKRYEALVLPGEDCTLPREAGARSQLADRMLKERGVLTAVLAPGEPNALTELEVLAVLEPPEAPPRAAGGALHLGLRPRTGRTHQLRLQLSSRGAPILGEDLYPEPCTDPDGPLQLLARSLSFTDPVTRQSREFHSRRSLAGLDSASAPWVSRSRRGAGG